MRSTIALMSDASAALVGTWEVMNAVRASIRQAALGVEPVKIVGEVEEALRKPAGSWPAVKVRLARHPLAERSAAQDGPGPRRDGLGRATQPLPWAPPERPPASTSASNMATSFSSMARRSRVPRSTGADPRQDLAVIDRALNGLLRGQSDLRVVCPALAQALGDLPRAKREAREFETLGAL